MKKIYLLLLLCCSALAFTACSDDEKDDPTPVCPVTGYTLPTTAVAAGSTLTIPGTGFTAAAKIILRNSANQDTPATDLQPTEGGGITVRIPATLAAGVYTVILQQGGDWELGSITLIAAGPIKDLDIPATATAGESITIGGKGFDENTVLYLESDELTANELVISDITANGLSLKIPAILPDGTYRVMLDSGDGIRLGEITIAAKSTPARISRIIKEESFGGDTTTFQYTGGQLSSFRNFSEYTDITYTIERPSATSITLSVQDSYSEHPVVHTYTLDAAGKVTKEEILRKEQDYPDDWTPDMEDPGFVDKTSEFTYGYGAGDYLERISETLPDGEMNDLSFVYENGKITETTQSYIYTPGEAPDDYTITLNHAKEIGNTPGFDVMSIVMYIVNSSQQEYFVRLLGICGTHPTHLPTSFTTEWATREITYTAVNGYITKIVFPDPDDAEFTKTYRLEYE